MNGWLFAAGVANIAATPVYGYVGLRLYQRPVPDRARLPSAQFALWWWGLGWTGFIAGLEALLFSIGALTFPLAFTLYLLTVLGDCIILWGLVGYLLYLYTGKYHLLELSAFYAAFYVTVLFWVISSAPESVVLTGGRPALVYAHQLGGPVLYAVLLGLVFPELIASLLYISLFRRTKDRTLRYRIAVVSAALLLYFGAGLFTPSGSGGAEAWNLLTALLEVGSAVLALFAFFPPEPLRRLLGVSAVPREEAPGDSAGASL
jgi:hypothetical protein